MTHRDGTLERREEIYRDALEVIAHEYASELTLEQLARRLATSRRALQRAFAEVGGTTYRDAVAKVRMQHAREMLATEALPVRDVGERVGYMQPSRFAKVFRRHHGVAPSDFRQHGRGQTPIAA